MALPSFKSFVSSALGLAEASRYRGVIKLLAEVFFRTAHLILRWMPGKSRCPVCDAKLLCVARRVIGDDLAKDWSISPSWRAFLDDREGQICIACGASLRIRHLATVLVDWVSTHIAPASTLNEALTALSKPGIRIAEINSCGALHKFLARLPSLSYSEYTPDNKSIPHEDLMDLSYPNNWFDVVLHSDTFEHTPDVTLALGELHRVLKPGGVTIFTVPIVADGRPSITRAAIRDGTLHHMRTPSYHGGSLQNTRQYLVFYEFGTDFLDRISLSGLRLHTYRHPTNPTVLTLVAEKPCQE